MKQLTRLSLIICGLFICFSLGLAQDKTSTASNPSKSRSKRIKTIYDKSKDETSVVLTPMTVSEIPGKVEALFPAEGGTRKLPTLRLQMMAYFSFPGKTLITPDHVVLGFLSLSQGDARFVNDRELTVIADGSRLNLGEMRVADRRVDSDMPASFYKETLELPVANDVFIRIAKAAKVTMHLGKAEFDLSADQRDSLRALANKMKS